jgi:hypothetical protein
MVEAVGVEPTSEKRVSKASTCVSLMFWFSPFAFWSRALRRGGQPLSYPEAARGCRDLRSTTSVVLKERRGSGLPNWTSRLFRPRGRSYRSQLSFPVLRAEARHAAPAPLCPPSKPVHPQVAKEPYSTSINQVRGRDIPGFSLPAPPGSPPPPPGSPLVRCCAGGRPPGTSRPARARPRKAPQGAAWDRTATGR